MNCLATNQAERILLYKVVEVHVACVALCPEVCSVAARTVEVKEYRRRTCCLWRYGADASRTAFRVGDVDHGGARELRENARIDGALGRIIRCGDLTDGKEKKCKHWIEGGLPEEANCSLESKGPGR